tara:strand:- start:1421 stop:1582 length:162 start_codon:yes stop_codon:yes gene_type:complete
MDQKKFTLTSIYKCFRHLTSNKSKNGQKKRPGKKWHILKYFSQKKAKKRAKKT